MLRLHHTGLLVRDLPTAAAELVARLGYVVESGVIEDPVQTALVQFLRQPGTSSWLELVTPNGPTSKLSRAVASGGGLHHLCYEEALHLDRLRLVRAAEAIEGDALRRQDHGSARTGRPGS